MTTQAQYFVTVGTTQNGHYTSHFTKVAEIQNWIDGLKSQGRAVAGDIVKIYNSAIAGTEAEKLMREGVIS